MGDYEKQGLLHQMFSRQAKATPSQVALVEENGRQMTFKELDEQTDILACYLRCHGVVTDTCVGIYLQKSIEFTISYIAILKAGGAYLPLDIAYPPALLDSILTDAQPVIIITSSDLAQVLKDKKNVLVLHEDWPKDLDRQNKTDQYVNTDQSSPTTLDSLAYIVYSSGTTGKPKGVMCPHRGSVFSYHWRHLEFPYNADDREACNIFFTWEMLRPLLKGTPMYIIPNTVIYDPPVLCDFLQKHHITRMLFTPSLLEAVLNTSGLDLKAKLKSLRQIWFCGEVVTTALFERCLKLLPWIQFLNLYSVSECHDVACEDLGEYFCSNQGALTSRKFCPVGRILPGVHVVILDDQHNPQPVGSSGEIYVGGPTLAQGYLHRPEQQAVRFIPRPGAVPEGMGDTLYRTGDWGYMLSDGSLEICGRCDSMVKIRGYSIEVQAVEAAIIELPLVTACIILVEGEEGDHKFLVAYVVTEGQTSKKALRAALKLRLPFYMIPAYFVLMASLPIVETTGKLDKKALPPFDKDQCENEVDIEAQPSTAMEKEVAHIWKAVLQIKDVDIQESFFDLGGHSLLATQLLVQLRDKYQVDIAVRDLFVHPTIASISQLITAKMENAEVDTVIPKVTFDLKEEVARHDMAKVDIDMKLRAFWRIFNLHNQSKFQQARVLLTGTTGFLGAFLLRELLLTTKTLIYCVVRDLPDNSPSDRVQETLQQFGILPNSDSPTEEQTSLEKLFSARVTMVKGDVALIKLGMNEDDYTYLCTDIDYIIHAAASVNLVYPYSALQGANVNGTANIVLFACIGKIKPIHFISTDAVFPNGLKDCGESVDILLYHDQLTDGYSQSKWVAEQLISRAGQRGIPVIIYRLGNMSGDMTQAYWNPQDFTLLMIQAMTKFGVAPDVDWLVEMTPVDFASKLIVKMTYNLSLALGKVFHVLNSRPVHCRWLYKWMTANGFPVEVVKFSEWRRRVLEGIQHNGMSHLQRLIESYIRDESFFSELSTYRTDNLDQALSQLDMEYPATDGDLLKTYFSHLRNRGVISTSVAARREPGPLDGKVAIITGSSSGIGKAIAKALAESGAKVSMAARRVDKLQEVEKEITASGGVAISVKTDVTKREEVKELVKHTESILGPVDILVNNAGTMFYTMMKNIHEDEWEMQVEVNIKGVNNGIGAVLDGMLQRQAGHIVNMSSDAGRKGFPGLAVYSGTKFYVEGLSQALRQEVCKSGVRVTCIQPGDVQTELFQHTTDNEAQAIYDGRKLCRILDPEDIARAVVYAVTQPPHVAINEILIEPREAPA